MINIEYDYKKNNDDTLKAYAEELKKNSEKKEEGKKDE